MKQIIFAATLAGALFLGNFANAQSRGKQDHRKKSQHERIQDGVRKGSITRGEAMRLNMQQAKLRGYKQMAKADGRVNKKERKLMYGEVRRADRNIYKAKHNGQFRKGAYAQKGGPSLQGREGFRGNRGDIRKGGPMAFRGHGHPGRGGDQFRRGEGNNSYKGQGFRGRDGYRGEYRKGGQQYKKSGENSRKGGDDNKKTTWNLNDDNRSGSWQLN